jgi:uncharacterized coiled-coil protein SlyX
MITISRKPIILQVLEQVQALTTVVNEQKTVIDTLNTKVDEQSVVIESLNFKVDILNNNSVV